MKKLSASIVGSFPTLEELHARFSPPAGYEDCRVISRNDQLIWLRDADILPTDLICFFDGDCRDVLTPYDSRVQPPFSIYYSKNDSNVITSKVKNMNSIPLMKYNPVDGTTNPYPSEAFQFRAYHGEVAWLYNPYTGAVRDPRDIGTDVFGKLIVDSQNKRRHICDKIIEYTLFLAADEIVFPVVETDFACGQDPIKSSYWYLCRNGKWSKESMPFKNIDVIVEYFVHEGNQ